ncbi:hypothetical protein B0H63DRAFT_551804 [Podospora didyma]|uniref:Cyanovirin-N domain-containing protein n=1 Tax=Podospora didyma TaxID=330526 RepID=A0AAE0K4G4_9PEZI|nr:hypothetical protein B0H63DRAFT_551804 [Podospora didyma]
MVSFRPHIIVEFGQALLASAAVGVVPSSVPTGLSTIPIVTPSSVPDAAFHNVTGNSVTGYRPFLNDCGAGKFGMHFLDKQQYGNFYVACPDINNRWWSHIDLNKCLTNDNGNLRWVKDTKPTYDLPAGGAMSTCKNCVSRKEMPEIIECDCMNKAGENYVHSIFNLNMGLYIDESYAVSCANYDGGNIEGVVDCGPYEDRTGVCPQSLKW